jgi:hypothetical protein
LRLEATKKKGSQIVLKLGDGTHLHQEKTKEKKKKKKNKGELKLPLCKNLAMVPTCA